MFAYLCLALPYTLVILLEPDCAKTLLYIPADPAHVIIPILASILLLPILVIITICSIRIRNIRARQKRIKDWAKENKIPRSTDNVNDKVLILDILASSLLPTKPVVRFMIPLWRRQVLRRRRMKLMVMTLTALTKTKVKEEMQK